METLLFLAKQVSNAPLSSRCKSLKTTVEVTVEPEDTSEVSRIGWPDQTHRTIGLGRPRIENKTVLKCVLQCAHNLRSSCKEYVRYFP